MLPSWNIWYHSERRGLEPRCMPFARASNQPPTPAIALSCGVRESGSRYLADRECRIVHRNVPAPAMVDLSDPKRDWRVMPSPHRISVWRSIRMVLWGIANSERCDKPHDP